MNDVPPPPPPGSDSQYAGYNTQAVGDTTDHPFHGLFGKIKHGVSSAVSHISDKTREVTTSASEQTHHLTTSPQFVETTHGAGHVAANMGIGVVNGVKQDGIGMVNDVKTGNYGHALLRAAPLLAGGPLGFVVKEVAPHVVGEGIKQLPAGTRASIESSGVGRIVVGAAERGHIPTSPAGIVAMAAETAKHQAIDATIRGATNGRLGTMQETPGGYPYPQSAGAYGRGDYAANQGEISTGLHATILSSLGGRHMLPGLLGQAVARTVISVHTDGGPAVSTHIGLPGGLGARVNLHPNFAAHDQIVSQTRAAGAVQVNAPVGEYTQPVRRHYQVAEPQVNYNQSLASRDAGAGQYHAGSQAARQTLVAGNEATVGRPAAPAAQHTSNQVFPSWMKPASSK